MVDLDEKGAAKMAKKNREGDSVLWALESLRDRHKRLGQHDSAVAVSNAITWVKRALRAHRAREASAVEKAAATKRKT